MHRCRIFQQHSPGAQRSGNLWAQLSRKRSNGFFHVDVAAIYLFVSKQIGEFLEDVFPYHRAEGSSTRRTKILSPMTAAQRVTYRLLSRRIFLVQRTLWMNL